MERSIALQWALTQCREVKWLCKDWLQGHEVRVCSPISRKGLRWGTPHLGRFSLHEELPAHPPAPWCFVAALLEVLTLPAIGDKERKCRDKRLYYYLYYIIILYYIGKVAWHIMIYNEWMPFYFIKIQYGVHPWGLWHRALWVSNENVQQQLLDFRLSLSISN